WLLLRIRRCLRPYRGVGMLDCVLQLVQTSAAQYLATLNATIIDEGVVTGDVGLIWRIGGLMLAISGLQAVTNVVAIYFGARTAMAMGRDVREGLFTRVMDFSTQEMTQFGTPSLITRSTNDVQQVQMFAFMATTVIIMAPIMLIGGVIMAVNQDAGLSLLLVAVVPVLAGTMAVVAWRMVPYFRAMQKRLDAINGVLREQITGIRVVRAFVKEREEAVRFERANADLRQVALKVGWVMALAIPLVMLIVNTGSIGVLWFGGHRMVRGALAGWAPGGGGCRRGGLDHRVPQLPDVHHDGGDDRDDDVHVRPAGGSLQRTDHGRARLHAHCARAAGSAAAGPGPGP